MGLQCVSIYRQIKPKHVYVSISKQADKNVIKKVLDYLACFEITVYTYDGGKYDYHDLINMDAMIIIPPSINAISYDDDQAHHVIGKGQYYEIDYFQRHCCKNKDFNEIFIVSGVCEGLYVYELNEITAFEVTNTWDKWGVAITNNQMINLNNYDFKALPGYYDLCYDDGEPAEIPLVDKTNPILCLSLHVALTKAFI